MRLTGQLCEIAAGGRISPVTRAKIFLSAAALIALSLALAQCRTVFAQRLEFEVASIKRNTSSEPPSMVPQRSGDRVFMRNAQLYTLIYYAYHLSANYQMVGYAPLPEGWDWYDIEARTGSAAAEDQLRLMFQSLLEDRFKLKVHRETKQLAGYELVIAKGQSKLKHSINKPMVVTIEGKSFPQREGACSTTQWRDGSHLTCHSASMDQIAAQVSATLGAPVADRTGLPGTYDLHIRYLSDERKLDADVEPGPSLQQALQEELELKLKKGMAPTEVLVIDHLEKPSEN
jgi:uncharacterized protein (TIGR03435 family)